MKLNKFPYAASTILAFAASMLFFIFFFRHFYHGDLALPITLAGAIRDSGQLFPKDFYYGNDLIFLRPQWLVAITLIFVEDVYTAYAVACSVAISICFLALSQALARLSRFSTGKAILVALLVLFPIGYTEYDFMIGQQSHLQSVTLSIISVIALHSLFVPPWRNSAALVLFSCVALVTCDSPPRGAILFVALLSVAAVMYFQSSQLQTLRRAGLAMLASVAVGGVANRLTGVRPVGVGNDLVFDADNAIQRLSEQAIIFINRYVGMDGLQNEPILSGALPVFAAKLLLAFVLVAMLVLVAKVALRILTDRAALPALWVAMGVSAVVSIAIGVVLVSYSRLNIDVRHYLFGLVALKAAVLVLLAERRRYALVAATATILIGSSVTLFVLSPQFRDRYLMRTEWANALLVALEDTIETQALPQPVTFYGSFANTMPYEFFAPNAVAAAPIAVDRGGLIRYEWLSRPSRYCKPEPALLAVSADDSQMLAVHQLVDLVPLKDVGGVLLYEVPGTLLDDCR